jgi:hypothetical protein
MEIKDKISIILATISVLSISFNIYQYMSSRKFDLKEKKNRVTKQLLDIKVKIFDLSVSIKKSHPSLNQKYSSEGYGREIAEMLVWIKGNPKYEMLCAVEAQAMKIETEINIFFKEIEIENNEKSQIIDQGFVNI